MKNLLLLIVFICSAQLTFGQDESAPAIIVISSSSTPQYISEMKQHLRHCGLIFNVEKEIWANQAELQEFAFTLTNAETRDMKSFHFKYNDLNKHQIFMVYPTGEHKYDEVITDVTYLRTDLLSLLVPLETRKQKPSLYRSYAKSGTKYRETILLKDLEILEREMTETVALYSKIKADQTVGRSISGMTYTYNGAIVNDPANLNLNDMTADVLIEVLSDDSRIVNIWSENPLKEMAMSSNLAGQE